MGLYSTGFALITRMRILLNRIRVKEREVIRLEKKELSDEEKGELDAIKKDFTGEMSALREEIDKFRSLYHDQALFLHNKIDAHIKKAEDFIADLERRDFPVEHRRELANAFAELIRHYLESIGETEDELERIRTFGKEELRRAA
ncbi:hypothetical protein KY312_03685 [Candidatus Woesearchaeota archaeon]|nr:hypothetical protein [Candidatus Woesearchaeota archaeon]